MILAPLRVGQETALRALLASMNRAPGMADPENPILPFGRFERLHVARLIVLVDQTPDDGAAYGMPRSDWRPSLVFLGDCDGPAEEFLGELAQRAEPGLRRLFAFCRDFPAGSDLLAWMKQRSYRPAALYVNWVGRTVRQIREEDALRRALVEYLQSEAPPPGRQDPSALREKLIGFAREQQQAGRLTLTDPDRTPLGWRVGNLIHGIGVPLVLLILAPLLLLYLPVFAWQLRRREKRDREVAPRPDPLHIRGLAEREDHDVTNQFSAVGMLKPGLFRRWTVVFLLWLLDYASRHIYNRGHLTRVRSIHFARWVFLDGRKRLLFASNYDGSLESYMDDFINKVGWGLNLVFSNGIGYPTTSWLINGGSKNEQKFKYYLRRHESPTDVWYKAYPGLTTFDLARNARIRRGLAQSRMSDAETREWLSLF